MQKEITFNEKDEVVMNLLHYFVTVQNYNPVIVHGVSDEIWLENMGQNYKIVRIVSKYIHNDEQLKFDLYKCEQISKKLKVKTLSWKMPVLNIYVDLGDSVNLEDKSDRVKNVFLPNFKNIKKNFLKKVFPDIDEKTKHSEEGVDLFVKITEDINRKNYRDSNRLSKIFAKKYPFVTYAIIIICVVVFAMMYIIGNGSTDNFTLLKFGANLDVAVKHGEYYRLFTSMFLHIGFVHLLFNMYSLLIIGQQVESFFGKWKYLFIYLFSGISGSLLSICFTHNTISAGASGAIFGLLGALLYFGYSYRNYLGNVIKSQIIPIILINLLIGFTSTGIDNFAHIGGLIGGVIAAMAMGVPDKSTKQERINGSIVAVIYVVFVGYLAFVGI